MNKSRDILKELAQIAGEGAEFYAEAARLVQDPQLAELFGRMERHKRAIATSLATSLAEHGEVVPQRGVIGSALRRVYADVLRRLPRREDRCVTQLEDVEERLLQHLHSAMTGTDDAFVQQRLMALRPKVRLCHETMRDGAHRRVA